VLAEREIQIPSQPAALLPPPLPAAATAAGAPNDGKYPQSVWRFRANGRRLWMVFRPGRRFRGRRLWAVFCPAAV
jgi:hypothetical protein